MVFKVGDKARLVHMPPAGACHVGKLVTILPLGGFVFDDDAFLETEDGARFMVTEDYAPAATTSQGWRLGRGNRGRESGHADCF